MPNVASLVPKQERGQPKDDIRRMKIRGVMPQPKEEDKILELMLQRTTTITPPPVRRLHTRRPLKQRKS
ncbi:unnamed protein product [Bursaphelenchus xylophilus]|uniref:(pine wood nematode) hypothetical protein n=1 Tax=Bursaphelenchus xylophilus TaxID=6326 RepID=A0A1I7RMF4_BURXY|nr:unnamed protein product [Bursaphelenchus xylophilus]CAG9118438.1 unnamed protein product [Bursaphelenchus xylophilus]